MSDTPNQEALPSVANATVGIAGTHIGKYEILQELGRGATSVVYKAYDPFQNRQVAIKSVFPDVLGDKENGGRYRKLFVTEASLAGKLSHPHITAIYDAVAAEEGSLHRHGVCRRDDAGEARPRG